MMASGKSTASLHGAYGDTIPKEYHRRVLKKIAQLTKVVYCLHTKNDENEERIESLIEEHSKEKQKWLTECDNRLKEQNEEKIRNQHLENRNQDLKNENQDLENKVVTILNEKDGLLLQQTKFVEETDQRHQLLVDENDKILVDVKTELNHAKDQLLRREREINEFENKLNNAVIEFGNKECELKTELDDLKQQNITTLKHVEMDMLTLKTEHEQNIDNLTKKHEEEIASLQNFLSTERDSILQLELERMKDKCKKVELEVIAKETNLQDKLSNLSAQLFDTKDRLAISQQRERHLEDEVNRIRKQSQETNDLLDRERANYIKLQEKLRVVEKDMSLLTGTQEIQNEELKKISSHADQLEGMKIQSEKHCHLLQQQLKEMTQKLLTIEEKRMIETEGYMVSSNETKQRLHTMEQEIERLSQEKKQLHIQYAREIEAAHSCLSDSETMLKEKHAMQIKTMETHHKAEIESLKVEKERAIELLQEQYESKMSIQESCTSNKYQENMKEMSTRLTDKSKHLLEMRKEIDNMRSVLSERERELQSANTTIVRLQEEIRIVKQQTIEIQNERDSLETRLTQSQMSLDVLNTKYQQSIILYKEEIKKTEKNVKKETEEIWNQKLKSEISIIRNELEAHFLENEKNALSKMAELKDSLLKEREETWNKDKKTLRNQIKLLQKELEDLKFSSEAALLQIKAQFQKDMDKLNDHCFLQITESDQTKQDLINNHIKEIGMLKQSYIDEKKKVINTMTDTHQHDLLEYNKTNQIAMETLREELMKKEEEEKERLQTVHQSQIDVLQYTFSRELTEKLGQAQMEYDNERRNNEKAVQIKIANLNYEISKHKTLQASLETQLSDYEIELSKTKHRVSIMTVNINEGKKLLEMKEREIQMTLLETKNQLKISEDELITTHRIEMESLLCQHKHQTQLIINEFNRAKEMLTRKLNESEKSLREAELKYQNRDPRREDIATIRELTTIVKEQERKMKQLISEKKVYQMELMNREKNYNKVFNANPQIGVLDPLKGKRRSPQLISSTPTAMRFSSAPNLVPLKSENKMSLPTIGSINSLDYRDNPHRHSTPQLYPHQSNHDHTSLVQNDFGLIPSPSFHRPHYTSPSPSSTRPLKFLSDHELPSADRTHTKNSAEKPLQSTFSSIPNTMVA